MTACGNLFSRVRAVFVVLSFCSALSLAEDTALDATCQATLRARMSKPLALRVAEGLSPSAKKKVAALQELIKTKPTEVRFWAKRGDDGSVVLLKRESLFADSKKKLSARVAVYLSSDEDDARNAAPGFVVSAMLNEDEKPSLHVHDASLVEEGCSLARGRSVTTDIVSEREMSMRTRLRNGEEFDTPKATSPEALGGAAYAQRLIAGEPDSQGERTTRVFYGNELPDVELRTGALEHARMIDPWTGQLADFALQKVDMFKEGKSFFQFEVGQSSASPFHFRRYPSIRLEEDQLSEAAWSQLALARPVSGVQLQGFHREDFGGTSLRLEYSGPSSLGFDNGDAYYEVGEQSDAGVELRLRHAIGAPKTFDAKQWLAETKYYEVNDPAIRKLAKGIIAKGTTDRRALAQHVLDVVYARMTYDMPMFDLGASRPIRSTEILKRSTGVCQHFAALYVTLARAVGLPARQVVGLLLGSGGIDAAGHHAWAEVSLDGSTWLPLEPQRSELGLGSIRYLPFGVYEEYEQGNTVAMPATSPRPGMVGEKIRIRRVPEH